jgi:hypothetical protein
MYRISEQLACHDRKVYLKAHSDDYPFPLNGTDWAREIREHQFWANHPSERCAGPDNFLSRLHGRKSLLNRQRAVLYRAMSHWFLQDLDQAFWMSEQISAGELARLQLKASKSESVVSSLLDIEKSWIKKKLYADGSRLPKVLPAALAALPKETRVADEPDDSGIAVNENETYATFMLEGANEAICQIPVALDWEI